MAISRLIWPFKTWPRVKAGRIPTCLIAPSSAKAIECAGEVAGERMYGHKISDAVLAETRS